MNLIIILLALAVETFYKPVSGLRRFDWFTHYQSALHERLESQPWRDGPAGVIAVIGLVVLAVWIAAAILGAVAGLLAFLFALLVLIFSLGPRDLEADTAQVLHSLEHEDSEAALLHAQALGEAHNITATSTEELVMWVRDRVMIEANTRMFGVLFWFLLLGPVGAVLFRLSSILNQQQAQQDDGYARAARDMYWILAWLPARLTVLCYALAGNFVATFAHWQGVSDLWQRDTDEFLINSGAGALQGELAGTDTDDAVDTAPIQQALALVKRALIVWIVLLALLTLTGYVF